MTAAAAPIQPPEHLSEAARAEWDRLAPELHAGGTLTQQTAGLLAALCVAYVRWVDAERHVAEKGPIVKSPNGFPVQNPYLTVANRAIQQVRQLSAELGLTPRGRKGAGTKPKPAPAPQDLPRVRLHKGAG